MMLAAMSEPGSRARHGGSLKLHRDADSGEVSKAQRRQQVVALSGALPTGTALAIGNLTLGGAALPGKCSGRGGARNRADRVSHGLTTAHVANLKAAERHARRIGLPFNRMVSIHWEAAGVSLHSMSKATGRYLDCLTKTLARHGARTAWLWVHENGAGKGGHCHVLVHIPAALVGKVTALQRGWLRRITGTPYRARVIRSKPIGGLLGLEKGNPDLHAVNLGAAMSYILKGADAEAAAQSRFERLEPCGKVVGKRCGTSQNIGAKARIQRTSDDRKNG